jgi:hypothetical protein
MTICPHCGKEIDSKTIAKELGKKGGSKITKRKKVSSIKNGKKGGRPLKNKIKNGDVK